MELQIARSERVLAPLQFVWEEMNSLDRLLTKGVQLAEYEVLLTGDLARGSTILAWGPVKKMVHLDVTLLGLETERQVRYAIEAPSIELRFEASIDLVPLGQHETNLAYGAILEVRHRLAARHRHLLDEIAEGYVDGVIGRIRARSEKRRLAEERLLA